MDQEAVAVSQGVREGESSMQMSGPNEVIIDGVKYAPVCDNIKIYYMHDNHTSSRVYGTSLNEILANADILEKKSPCGMLCDVTVFAGKKEIRRVGACVHSWGKRDHSVWANGKSVWVEEVMRDPDITRLLSTNVEVQDED